MIDQSPAMLITPMTPKKVNQINMIGPNALPMILVPIFWIEKSTSRIITVIMITISWVETGTLPPNWRPFNPSIAVVTVTAGVNVPSAKMAAPPIKAGNTSHLALFLTKVYRAKIPPSPWLVAFSAIKTVCKVVSSVTVQRTKEMEPMMKSRLTFPIPPLPSTIDFIT